MDFRALDASSVTWGAWYRGAPAAKTADKARVVVQTPQAPVRVSMVGGGMFRMDMRLRPDVPLHAAFCEWIADVEDSASQAPELAEWRAGKSRSSTVYNGNLRLMAFGDTLTFDAAGKLSFDLLDAACCACLVELQGCWSSESRWGLRWRVVQVKFDTQPMDLPAQPPPPAQSAFIAEPAGPRGPCGPAPPAAFAFLDD
jgi:hypothetical protein